MPLDAITEYWFAHYLRRGMCSLCGQSGILDTRTTAITGTGLRCGDIHFCICPNGQKMRETGKSAAEWRDWQWERANRD